MCTIADDGTTRPRSDRLPLRQALMVWIGLDLVAWAAVIGLGLLLYAAFR